VVTAVRDYQGLEAQSLSPYSAATRVPVAADAQDSRSSFSPLTPVRVPIRPLPADRSSASSASPLALVIVTVPAHELESFARSAPSDSTKVRVLVSSSQSSCSLRTSVNVVVSPAVALVTRGSPRAVSVSERFSS
jgi:hypothetical protein